jgi:hypothetical protein
MEQEMTILWGHYANVFTFCWQFVNQELIKIKNNTTQSQDISLEVIAILSQVDKKSLVQDKKRHSQ